MSKIKKVNAIFPKTQKSAPHTPAPLFRTRLLDFPKTFARKTPFQRERYALIRKKLRPPTCIFQFRDY